MKELMSSELTALEAVECGVFQFPLRLDVVITNLSMEIQVFLSLHTCMSLFSMPDVGFTLRRREKRHRNFDCRPSSRMNWFPRVRSKLRLFELCSR